jgi:hypothetical protein
MSLSIIGQFLVNMNILAATVGALQMGPKNEITVFSKVTLTIFILNFRN